MAAQREVIPTVEASNESHELGELDSQAAIAKTATPEIVIALCGPLGTPLHEVAKEFKSLLSSSDYGYESVNVIRLSSEIRKQAGIPETEHSINQLIEAGNTLRKSKGNRILASLAVRQIALHRENIQQESNKDIPKTVGGETIPTVTPKTCHIIDSIKHIEELELLRSIYGNMLHVIGVYSPIEVRVQKLERIKGPKDQIHELIDRDSGEELGHGQQVGDTFPQADFFMRIDSGTDSQRKDRARRFLDLMLGTKIITPTIAERAMYTAFSAARNSACLSRQVGASITNQSGEILATGWNDVPRPFGGLYESIDIGTTTDNDHRCWNKDGGHCFNDSEKNKIADAVVDKLIEKRIIAEEKKTEAFAVIRKDSQLKTLIEFSRAVHAEMHALLSAGSTKGDQIKGGKLFVTTYPCHSCARHIVAAGVSEVYFLEPYRKSLATKLHDDALTEQESDGKKVRIIPFDGVAPSRYLSFFSTGVNGRKNKEGKMQLSPAFPVTAPTIEAVATLEGIVVKRLQSLDQ
ncbi:anti-phage dCTP deaminase [Salinicola salarius]|uniref:anti-phage dCTP deaminase n=1 Tax=Salinicola salarius TaxID=430457 RepID=UPI001ABF2DB9|nr:anti-phage dCTP deaminase [Salinicola salarius]